MFARIRNFIRFWKYNTIPAHLETHSRKAVIFQAIAFGLYHHLVRGKVFKDDPVYKYIQPYLLGVYKGYRKRI